LESVLVTNHVLSGALIGATVQRPSAAFALGVASHFALDAVPHWGDWGSRRRFLRAAVPDGLAGLAAIGALTAVAPPEKRLAVLAGMAGAALPDLDKPSVLWFGRSPFPRVVDQFHGSIQREGQRLFGVEVVAAAVFGTAALALLRNRRRRCAIRQDALRDRALCAARQRSPRRLRPAPVTASLESMGVIASIDAASVSAEPGAETSCTVRVRNTGMVVDQVLLDVLGDARPWVTVEPAQLNMLPGSDALAQVMFRPPRSSAVAAGTLPFAVRAMSTEDPAGSTIEEGTVEVSPFSDLRAVLAPGSARGRRSARYRLIVENEGNTPAHVAITVSDPDLLLEFKVKPETLVAQPGTATYVRLRTSPKRRFMKGPDRPLPFQALLQADDCAPATVNGVMVHEQILPTWLMPAIATAAAVVAALAVLWFTVLKPEVHTMATQAVQAATQQLTSSAAKANKAAQDASTAARQASRAAQQAAGSSAGTTSHLKSGGGSAKTGAKTPAAKKPAAKTTATKTAGKTTTAKTTSTGSTPTTAPAPVSSMLQSSAPPSTTFSTVTFPVAADKTLSVSDIVLENPLGDTGLLQVRAGSTSLFVFGLANFRSIDYHFVQPLVFTHAAPLVLAVECQNPGTTACTDDLSFSGTLQSVSR
jgi:hypothetical protein